MALPPGARNPRFLPEQEVRFAVVMYGGVSLAIYINGVAQELFRLVKATAPADPYPRAARQPPEDRRVYFADPEVDEPRPKLEHSEPVYRQLGQWLGLEGPVAPAPTDGEPPPIRTRFVVDIISGTSAGGINGVFLGKAIANQQEFDVSADLWLKVADIAQLLRGEGSWGGIPEAGRREPESLLNGHRLFWEARKALKAMEAGGGEIEDDPFRPAYAERLDLAVTTTDLAGQPRPVRLGKERIVQEPVHKKVLRFEYGIKETLGEDHSDFGADGDLMLAFAARATSSFPFAFEPVKLDDVAFMSSDFGATDTAPFFDGYAEPAAAFFADGGYLDNKPFTYATQALRNRRADVPVARKLLYIEPDPAPETPADPGAPERPDVYQNVLNAMAALPRFEPIRQDIAEVGDHNRAVVRLRSIELDAVRALESQLAKPPAPAGPGHEAYLSLRARTVLDRLADLAAQLRGWAQDDQDAIDARKALGDWASGRSDRAALFERLDTEYVQRRQSFLQDRANDLLRGGPRLVRMAQASGASEQLEEGDATSLRAFKLALNSALDDVRLAERAPRARSPEPTLDPGQQARLEAVDDAALIVAAQPEPFVDAVAGFLRTPLTAARDGIADALALLASSSWTGELLQAYDARFETFDAVVLPLAYPDLGEANAAELWRVSPRDAQGAAPPGLDDPVSKLAGLRLHHFGAFLDEGYRANDLLWGRLDGAEAIMRAVLPDQEHEELRERFRVAAHAAILREGIPDRMRAGLAEELRLGPGEENDERLVSAFLRAYTPPAKLDDARRNTLTGQALAIAGAVLSKDAKKHHVPELPLTVVAKSGPTIVRVARLRARLRVLNPFRRSR